MWKACFLVLCMFLALPLSAQQLKQPATPTGSIYHIRVGDKLSVKFLYHPELNEPVVAVRPDGMISLQLIDEIQVTGMTTGELTATLLKAYREVLLSPVITVSVIESVAPRVFIAGQVAKPGSYELRNGQSLFEVVALAGGFTSSAHRKMVLHARPAGNNALKVTEIDFTRFLKAKTGDLQLEDGDYIFIPDSKLSTFSRIVEAFRFAAPGFQLR